MKAGSLEDESLSSTQAEILQIYALGDYFGCQSFKPVDGNQCDKGLGQIHLKIQVACYIIDSLYLFTAEQGFQSFPLFLSQWNHQQVAT